MNVTIVYFLLVHSIGKMASTFEKYTLSPSVHVLMNYYHIYAFKKCLVVPLKTWYFHVFLKVGYEKN